jgi:predicted nuclease of restriction endonuclease-like (RecB) superfamily
MQTAAAHAVNINLTVRNWLIGYYIVEFEQKGEDRAKYGEQLLSNLEKTLDTKGMTERRFREYRRLYNVYPHLGTAIVTRLSEDMIQQMALDTDALLKQLPMPREENSTEIADLSIRRPVAAELQTADNDSNTIEITTVEDVDTIRRMTSAKFTSSIRQPVDAEFQTTDNDSDTIEITDSSDVTPIRRTASAKSDLSIRQTASAELQVTENEQYDDYQWMVPPHLLLSKLAYSHLAEIAKLEQPIQRAFYELEAMKGCWSVAELQRQINTLYFERSGLSKNKEALSALVNQRAVKLQPKDIINTPITLEFLNLSDKALVTEDDLEQAILDNIQDFLLEMGHGFCFEARQKRILIDDEYFFVDLLFYHRILKCHVVIELKVDKFKHEYASQLNMYLSYFKHNEATKDDNPPVGILFCAEKGHEQLRYATAGMDESIFVSKYMVELPNIDLLKNYLAKELQEAQLASELRHLKNKSRV